jgi:hypothetical protein
MVPSMPISISVPDSQKSQSNALWNDLTNSSVGKKFHLAQVAQDSSGIGSFLSAIPTPVKQQQQGQTHVNNTIVPVQQGLPIENQAIATEDHPLSEQIDQSTQVPVVQVKDWSTDSSEGGQLPGAAESNSTDANKTKDQSSSSGGDSGQTEIALRPAMGTLSLAASMKHAVVLQVAEVKPTLAGARLKLLLKNNSTKELVIPENQKVACQNGDGPEQILDIEFATHRVPAGGSAYGIVKFSAPQVDPDTDFYLPHFLKDGSKISDLHATADD